MLHNARAMSSAVAELCLPFLHAPSKSFLFWFIFLLSGQNPKDFADFINIDKT
jgi:hypothetical protein